MEKLRRLHARDTIAAILIAFAPFIYFLPATLGRIVLAADDALIFGMPLRIAARNMIRSGHLPLWNPYIFCGMPLFATAQGGVLFPLNWGFLFTNANSAMNFAVLCSYAAAGVGAFLYARRSGSNLPGSVITAVVWQLCGVSVGQITHTNILHVYGILPWMLWSIDGYVTRPNLRRAAVISCVVALQVFAGHQQTLAYSLLLGGAYALVQATAPNELRRRSWLLAIAFLGVGVLLAAVQILPTAELLRESLRDRATYDFFSSYSLPPVFLLTWFAPYVLGGGDGILFRAPYVGEPFYPEYIGYVGLAPLVLAACAPMFRRDRRTVFWTWTALICLALAIGRFLPFDLYRVAYHVPILNLFRVPARYLMVVDFSLAVLAGRAVTILPEMRRPRRTIVVGVVSAVVLLLAWSVVTWLRPSAFHLARVAPVTVLRAPELFMPVALAIMSCWALLRFAQARRFSSGILIALIIFDLALWGQFSGWRTGSPRRKQNVLKTPQFVKDLRSEAAAEGPFRILTIDRPLADALANRPPMPGIDIKLQPDTYMIHRVENAAGYDGFGLRRYSRLAGDMKVWGEFPDITRSLLVSRELDLLNVRYIIAAASQNGTPPNLPANTKLGEFNFYEHELGLPYLERGSRLDFEMPPTDTSRVALVTNLAWSTALPDGTVAATVTLRSNDGRAFPFDLRVGIDTSEWAYDRPAVRSAIRHSRAPVATSSTAESPEGTFDAHSFVTSFMLPDKTAIIGGTIEVPEIANAPQFGLSVQRVSLIDESAGHTVPLQKEWISTAANPASRSSSRRWPEVKRTDKVVLYRNGGVMPRTWITLEMRALPDKQKLETIRSGKLPDGSGWDPARIALVDDADVTTTANAAAESSAKITRYEPNEVEIAARTDSPGILVLADNHYPGWRASVDGNPVPLLRVDYNLRGVQLTPGEHKVRFAYHPTSVLIGGLISLITATVLATGCWRTRTQSTI